MNSPHRTSPSIVFLVAESFAPANSGGRIRSLGIATALAKLGPLEVLPLDATDRTDVWGDACRAFARRGRQLRSRVTDRARGAIRGNLRLLERMSSAGGAQAFSAILESTRADLVVLSVPFFGPFVDIARARGALVIGDGHESLVRANRSILRSRVPPRSRLRALLDLQEARRFERREYVRVDQLWVSSDVERRHFEKSIPSADVRVVPNLAPGRERTEPAGPLRSIAYVGSYGYAPNEEAALRLIRDIAPAIRDRIGPIDLVLVGREPTREMRDAAANASDVRITGTVADPVVELREAGVLVVPLTAGAGSRVKILEAMQAGVPVVTTRAGLEGLDAAPGREVAVAESPVEFAQAIERLRSDDDERRRLVESAYAFVKEHHGQAAIHRSIARAVGEARRL